MNVLVIGSGGREHALVWAISRSPGNPTIFCAPGNAGTGALGTNTDLDSDDHEEVVKFCRDEKIGLVVIGPEAPLVDGLADTLRENKIRIFGPGKEGAMLEGSKVFSKGFCDRHGIPTAAYKVFEDYNKAHVFIDNSGLETCVVKADGLAAGKGAIVCDDSIDAHAAIDTILKERKFGDAGNQTIIEDRLSGFETTLLTLVSGSNYVKLLYSQDHKRAFDGDRGPNTGGMGVFAPTPKVTPELDEIITRDIIEPTIKGLADDKIDYMGCLYFGLMITDEGPYVIEYNCRFGDPEAQAVLPLMKGDFLNALKKASEGNLDGVDLRYSGKKALTVILASEGYPGKYTKGIAISNDIGPLEENENLIIFHAGTRRDGNLLFTNGGRVVAITALGDDFKQCRDQVYSSLAPLRLKGLFYRKDIGQELVTV
ncbi:MAG: phosphoribosylamine--glycine ligase [bacterium]|nr:phosphoribosylamine--glycine ligase [bacterium]